MYEKIRRPFEVFARIDTAENSIMQTITIAVSAILIAAGLVTAPGLINNARDNNATGDLANIAYAQEAQLASAGKYATTVADLQTNPDSQVKFTLAGQVRDQTLLTCPSGEAYLSKATSKSTKTFYRSSLSATTSSDITKIQIPTCLAASDVATFTAPVTTSIPGALAACLANAPIPVPVSKINGFSTSRTLTVCDNSTGTVLYSVANKINPTVAQFDVTVLAGNQLSILDHEASLSVIVRQNSSVVVGSTFPENWSVNSISLSDGMGSIVPLDCGGTLPTGVKGIGDRFDAVCTGTVNATANQQTSYSSDFNYTRMGNNGPDSTVEEATGADNFTVAVQLPGGNGGGASDGSSTPPGCAIQPVQTCTVTATQ
ncbi:hypothetical protein ACVXZ4_04085 [Lacisediminihabitans sp. FW035]